jgi:hypothetical protein
MELFKLDLKNIQRQPSHRISSTNCPGEYCESRGSDNSGLKSAGGNGMHSTGQTPGKRLSLSRKNQCAADVHVDPK